MRLTHGIKSSLINHTIRIIVVGAGGTGSALLPRLMQLHHAMIALGHPGGLHVTVYDSDTVSESNIGRQGFFPADVGLNKAMVLVNRLNMCWGTDWVGLPVRLNKSDRIHPDIVIGCVDTRKARAAIIGAVQSSHAYYLDCGNALDHGQVVLGEIGSEACMRRHDRLPTVADLFPDTVNPELDKDDDMPSCSLADALRKQNLVINMAMATEAFNLLWTLFRTGSLTYSGKFINLKSGIASPIRLDTDVWARMGYNAPQPKKRRSKKAAA